MKTWMGGLLALAACSSAIEPPEGGVDAQAELDALIFDATPMDQGLDAGVDGAMDADAEPTDGDVARDADPPDLGFDACGPGGGACAAATDCLPARPAPTNCEACVPSNLALCVAGVCLAPAILDGTDLYNVVVPIAPGLPPIESLSAFAIAAGTPSGAQLTCERILSGEVALSGSCLNVLEARSYSVGQSGTTYAVGFVGFASGQRTLFLIQAHTQPQARGVPVARSCTEVDVAPPSGTGPHFISGELLGP